MFFCLRTDHFSVGAAYEYTCEEEDFVIDVPDYPEAINVTCIEPEGYPDPVWYYGIWEKGIWDQKVRNIILHRYLPFHSKNVHEDQLKVKLEKHLGTL